jgi:hypothetical protein
MEACKHRDENYRLIIFSVIFMLDTYFDSSRGSSVSVVSDYALDDRASEIRSPAEARGFSCNLCVETSSGAHLASCTVGTGGPFPGANARPEHDADLPI